MINELKFVALGYFFYRGFYLFKPYGAIGYAYYIAFAVTITFIIQGIERLD